MNNDIFAKRLDQLGIKRQVDSAMIVARSQETITKQLGTRGSDNLRVVSYSKGVLKITATSGAWASECRGILDQLIAEPVKRVIFTSGSVKDYF